ncbi:AraC family transcriptional regulator [Paenibacillus sp. y28]|uniref:AraC family transcriptional regulator n=1 Tax=Paenibacillus sp. y28 TaxID=3129110 RepID=UPI00301A237C
MNECLFRTLTEADLRLPFYMTGSGGWNNQETVLREQGFPDYQWIQCLEGEGVLMTEGFRETVGPGQGMLLFPHQAHEYRAVQEPWRVRWVTFGGKHAEELLAGLGFTHSEVLYVAYPEMTLARLQDMEKAARTEGAMACFEASRLIYDLLLDLHRYGSAGEQRSAQRHYERLAPVLAYIEQNYARQLTLEELADELSVTAQHLCLLFQQTLGLRPFEYVNRCRIRKAKEAMLREPSLRVQDVAGQAGFEHVSYFIKRFRQLEGMTPSQFRRLYL